MAGGNFLLAGLMQGLGRGMEADYMQKRQDALENLRNQRQVESEERQESRTIEREGRQQQNAIELADIQAGHKRDLLIASGEETRRTNEQKFEQEIKLVGIKANEDRSTAAFKSKLDQNLASVKSNLDRMNDEYSQKLKAQLEDRNDPVVDQFNDINGRVVYRRKSGVTVTTPFYAERKVDTSVPIKKRDQANPDTPEGFDPNSQSSDGVANDWYKGQDSGRMERRNSSPAKTLTVAQVREAAKARGLSEAEVRRRLTAAGYRIE